jgi:SAM-dependent methyltransferase
MRFLPRLAELDPRTAWASLIRAGFPSATDIKPRGLPHDGIDNRVRPCETECMPEFVVEFGQGEEPPADGRLRGPAFERNHAPIWAVLAPFLQDRGGDVLEVGSGTGQHVVAYAGRSPAVTWWPSDIHPRHLASIAAWRAQAGRANVQAPLRVDLLEADWDAKLPVSNPLLAILSINVLHISPWGVTENLLAGAGRRLAPDGRLFVYGPFRRDGVHTAPSNAAFDASLRAQDPAWGVRDTRDVAAVAERCGLRIAATVPMPANNFTLVIARNN